MKKKNVFMTMEKPNNFTFRGKRHFSKGNQPNQEQYGKTNKRPQVK